MPRSYSPRRARVARTCEQCGAVFAAWAAAVARGEARFCKRECYSAWRASDAGHIPLAVLLHRRLERIDRSDPTACWEWPGMRNRLGYGLLALGRGRHQRQHRAHRLVYEMLVGPIPPGWHICHRCDNPPCVNPAHLFAGTRAANMQDAARKGRIKGGLRSPLMGSANPSAVLTDADVIAMRRRYAAGGVTQSQLAREYGLASQGAVSLILTRKLWRHLP